MGMYEDCDNTFKRLDSFLEGSIRSQTELMSRFEKEGDWNSFYFHREKRDIYTELRDELLRLFEQELDYARLEYDVFISGRYVLASQ